MPELVDALVDVLVDVLEVFIKRPGGIAKSRALYAKKFDCISTYSIYMLILGSMRI
jgi:hypothetical protein